jgi:hypothetical protein
MSIPMRMRAFLLRNRRDRSLALGWILSIAGVLGFFLAESPQASTHATGLRLVFLNGVDISAARGQQLKKVDVQIAENGDIYISAPHYQVHEEDSYVPLSQYVQGLSHPSHTKPGKAPEKSWKEPQPFNANQPAAKPGVPLSPPAASQSVKEDEPTDAPSDDEAPPPSQTDAEDIGEDKSPPSATFQTPQKAPGKAPLIPKGQSPASQGTQAAPSAPSDSTPMPASAAETGGPPPGPGSTNPPQTVQNTNPPGK